MRFRVCSGSPIVKAEIELYSPDTGQRSIGHNIITEDGLKSAAMMMFYPIDSGSTMGYDRQPDVENPSRARTFAWVLLGDGTTAPAPDDMTLNRYLVGESKWADYAAGLITPYSGLDEGAGWSRMAAILNGWRWSAQCQIEWGGPNSQVNEWCIASTYFPNSAEFKMLNHGTVDHVLTGETECTVRVSSQW